MMLLLQPFRILSALGFALSLIVHVAALQGMRVVSDKNLIFLFVGSGIVYIPAIFAAQWTSREFKRKEMWKAALRGCPAWMRIMVHVLGGYAVFSFILFALVGANHGRSSGDIWRQAWLVSAYGMTFYWTSFAFLHSALHSIEVDMRRRCMNGHLVSPLAKFCEKCGSPVAVGTCATEPRH
jgi:hypothetical protein